MFLPCQKEIVLKCLIKLTYLLQGPFHLEKNHDERIKRSVLIWGAQAPYRQNLPSWKKLTMKESREQPKSEVPRLQTDKHQWSGIVLLLTKSCSKNGVTVCCEEIMLKMLLQDVVTSVNTTASIMFIFSCLVVCTFTNKQKIVVCYFSVMITIKAMASMALFTVITTTCKNYKLSCLKMTSL